MALSQVTAPAERPVSLAEAKLHLRVDVDDENALIDGLIRAAAEYVENFTGRALVTQTWDYKLNDFPCWHEAIWIPKAPLSSVTSVTYTATDGTSTVWSSSLYTVDAPSGPHARRGCIVPAYQQIYPVARSVVNAVTVRFVAGYGAAAAVPASLKAAMKVLIGTWYGPGREGVNIGSLVTVIPQTVDALLWPFKAL